MGSKIDSQMQQIYSDCVKTGGSNGQKVAEPDAIKLITRAETLNNSYTSSCFSSSNRGNKYLKKLVNENPSNFTKEGHETIQSYLSTGRVPTSVRRPSGTNGPSSPITHNVNERPHVTSPTSGISANRPNTGAASHHPSANITSGGTTPRPNVSTPSANVTSGGVSTPRPNVSIPSANVTSGGVSTPRPNVSIPNANVTSGGVSTPRPNVSIPSANVTSGGVSTPRPNVSAPSVNVASGAIPTVQPNITTPNVNVPTSVASNTVTAPVVSPSVGGSGTAVVGGTTPVVTPNAGTTPVTPTTPSVNASGLAPTPVVPLTPHSSAGSGVVGAHGKEILNFQAAKSTWACHWWPLKETKVGGDPINNLYAEGGPLAKLDMVTGGSARDYELQKNRKAFGAGKQFEWWGHCNNASEAACVLQAPKHGVEMTAPNGAKVSFTKSDIQGLLVKVTPSLVNNVDFKGERYNNGAKDNPNDPKPEVFLETVQEWAKDGLPFVLDIDPKEQVWNFPYDKAKIFESDKAPQGFSGNVPNDGSVKYYHIEMSGTGFDNKARTYDCYVQRNSSGAVVSSEWIKTPNSHNNPDFMWRPHPVGDLMNKASWQLRGKPSNPNVDPQVIYDIYIRSLA